MPLIIPKGLPAKTLLEQEKIFIMNEERASTQDIRPLKVAILNLMPKKEEAELQLLRLLSNTPLQVEIDLIRTESYEPTHTDIRHLERFYKTFSQIKDEKYDAMIVTGAPVETLKFEEILYWEELKEILEYVRKNVFSAMFICWASQAALYHYYNIPKHEKTEKIFGVFEYSILKNNTLTKGFDDVFYTPQSRFTFNTEEEVDSVDDLLVLASREDTGVHLVTTKDYRLVFVAGHWEYDDRTLEGEFIRDKDKGMNPKIPSNYYINDDTDAGISVKWRGHGNLFFYNWLNYVYQTTPYEINTIEEKIL